MRGGVLRACWWRGTQASPLAPQFELIGLFDVLEHLPNDQGVLRDLSTMLAPGGVLMMTVPAHMRLWSYFDEAAHHRRRYSLDELRAKLLKSGYEIEYLTQFMSVLFPVMWLSRRFWRVRPQDRVDPQWAYERALREFRVVPVANGLLGFILSLELPLIWRRWQIPVGTSILAIARKPVVTPPADPPGESKVC